MTNTNDPRHPQKPSDPPSESPADPGSREATGPDDATIVGSGGGPESHALPASIGPYEIIGLLGFGGMGVVYEAEQPQPRRRVALKVIRSGTFVDDSRVRMFEREVDTLARLKHPNIGAIYDAGRTEAGEHFFAMELVRGHTLENYIQLRPGALDLEEVRLRLRLFRSICDAVNYAHQRGVIHRDLKPSNIIVVSGDEHGSSDEVATVKILDFGLARITETDVAATAVTEVGVIKGTLPYMSPEQTRGDSAEIDVRSDVYSLGVILFEMLTGKRPYDTSRTSILEAIRTINDAAPMPLRRAWPAGGTPDPDVETIIGKALEKSPDVRYGSAAALSEDIQRYLESRPILARPPSTMYQLRKFARRKRALVGGVAATFLALVAGVVTSTTFGLRASAQRQVAERARQDTEALVDFQQNMLREINPAGMGAGIADELRARLGEAMRENGAPDATIADALATFDRQIAFVNMTNVALHVIDTNILDRSLATARERFSDRPRVRARMEGSVGETYFTLGMLDKAETTLIATEALCDSAFGPGSIEAMDVINRRANVYALQGRMDEAVVLLEDILSMRVRLLEPTDPRIMQTRNDVAMVYADLGRLAEADSLLTVTTADLRRYQITESRELATTMSNHAWLYQQMSRYAEAESLGVIALEMRRRLFGDENPETLVSINNLAIVYSRTGRYAEAEALQREEYEASRRILGDDHPDLVPSMQNLGRTCMNQGKFEEAEQLLSKALATARKIFPPEYYGTGFVLASYGDALVQLGRHAEAKLALVEAYGILLPVLGLGHPAVGRIVTSMVVVCDATADVTGAAEWRDRLPSDGG